MDVSSAHSLIIIIIIIIIVIIIIIITITVTITMIVTVTVIIAIVAVGSTGWVYVAIVASTTTAVITIAESSSHSSSSSWRRSSSEQILRTAAKRQWDVAGGSRWKIPPCFCSHLASQPLQAIATFRGMRWRRHEGRIFKDVSEPRLCSSTALLGSGLNLLAWFEFVAPSFTDEKRDGQLIFGVSGF